MAFVIGTPFFLRPIVERGYGGDIADAFQFVSLLLI